MGAAGPRWVSGRVLAFLARAGRSEHGAPLVDAGAAVVDRVLCVPRQRYAAGDGDLATLGASLFVAVADAEEFGAGRVFLATLATLVFWEMNGVRPVLRPGVLVKGVRGAVGRDDAMARIALLARERTYGRVGYQSGHARELDRRQSDAPG